MNKKVLLIPNMPHWSVDKCARDLVAYNTTNLQLDIVYYEQFLQDRHRLIKEYDLIYPMVNLLFLEFLKLDIPLDKMATAVLSYTSWDNGKTIPPGYNVTPPKKHINQLKKALLVNTHCHKLWYIFAQHMPIWYTKYTCDLKMFYPDKKPRTTAKLVVGWTGSITNNGAIRGVEDIIEPACAAVDGIELRILCPERHAWEQDDNRMRDYYNGLDLYLCASKSEGTPRPVQEAAACGVPSMTVDVGIVPELITDGTNGFVVDRSVQAFTEKLAYIKANRDMLPDMGQRARHTMERDFNWEHLIYQWTDFFIYALELYKLKEAGHV